MQIFGGYEHTFALTSDGDVLAFGNGLKGQLGIGNTGTPLNCTLVLGHECLVITNQVHILYATMHVPW